MYLYPHFSAARAHRQRKDNGLILALHVLFLNLDQLNFGLLCLSNETALSNVNFDLKHSNLYVNEEMINCSCCCGK